MKNLSKNLQLYLPQLQPIVLVLIETIQRNCAILTSAQTEQTK